MDEEQDHSAVIEVLGRDGQVRMVHKLAASRQGDLRVLPVFRIGRATHCDVVLDDAHMAPVHAELAWGEHGATLKLLPSLNGGWLGERRLQVGEEAAPLGEAAQFQLGATRLRWRSSAAALAPELPLELHQHHFHAPRGAAAYLLPLLLLFWLGLLWLDRWIDLNPGARAIEYAAPVLWPLAAVLGWAALWSLVTQLFQHRFPFSTHLRRALLVWSGLQLIGWSLPLVAFAINAPRLMVVSELLVGAGGAVLLWWHAVLVWPRARKALALGLLALFVLIQGLSVARRLEQQYWFGPNYLSAIPPPALRLADTKPPETLIEGLRSLQPELARQAKKDNDGEPVEDEGQE